MNGTTKTIIYIGNFELPNKNAAAQRVIANGKIFRDLGYKVVYIGISKEITHHYSTIGAKKNYFDFDAWAVPYPKSRNQWLKQITHPVGLEEVMMKYDSNSLFAVICYNYPAVAQYKIKKICAKYNVHCIPDITEWSGSTGRGFLAGTIKWLDTSLRMNYLNIRSKALITTSPYLTSFYKKHVSNILELPTLYDSQYVNKSTSIKTQRHDPDCVTLLYAGSPFNLNSKKVDKNKVKDRLDEIILLLSKTKSKKFELNIYGLTKKQYLCVYPEHEKLLFALSKQVAFNGRRPHEEIIANIKACDFTIFFREVDRVTEAGFPSKFSESITCGTPVITNLISNIEPHLSIGKSGFLIDYKNKIKAKTIMDKILSLTRSEIDTMKEYCLKSQLFDYKQYIATTDMFFQKVKERDK